MDGQSPDGGGKLSVTAVRCQITDTGSSLEGDGRKHVKTISDNLIAIKS